MKKIIISLSFLVFVFVPFTAKASFFMSPPAGTLVCTDQDYESRSWGQCIHGKQTENFIKKNGVDCWVGYPQLRTCSPSICQENSYNVVWSKCVNDKQYSSFVKNEECTDGFVPPVQKDCVTPVTPPLCQESSYNYGDWTPCVNNISIRVVFKKESCNNGFIPQTQKNCSNVQSQESNSNIATTSNDYGRSSSGIINNEINPVITRTPISGEKDEKFANKLKGKILLQVESHGESWYVNPADGKMYYMADGNKAYDVMRNLGVGITNTDLEKIKNNTAFAKKHSGKIFLQVEANGEAYYVDFNGDAHYLKDGAAAHEVMRNLGLGITNDNLSKIPEGNL